MANNFHVLTSSLFAIALTAGTVAAQGYSLNGLTRTTQSLARTVHGACVAMPGCPAPGMPPHTSFAAGGTAFDGTTNDTWATSGQVLASYTGTTGCTIVCPPMPCPKSSAAANASGLDVVESMNQLWIVDDQNWLTQCIIGCPPVIVAQCMINTLPGDRISGVAVDDGNGLVFYTAINATGGNLYVAQIATPCSPFTVSPMPSCTAAFTPPQGVAADWGAATLYWTDGPSTYSFNYAYVAAGPAITYGPVTCCPFVQSPNDPYTDLTLHPRGSSPAGNPCANGTCPTCTNWHSLRNAPILGNTIQLGLDQAPEAALAWCLLSIGSCSAGAPTVPPLCGPLLVGPGPTLGFNITSGVAGCNGSTTFNVATPPVPAFAGLPIASQCVVLCGGVTGTALSNCQSWVLQGL